MKVDLDTLMAVLEEDIINIGVVPELKGCDIRERQSIIRYASSSDKCVCQHFKMDRDRCTLPLLFCFVGSVFSLAMIPFKKVLENALP